MSISAENAQKIGRLTPLRDVLAHVAAQVSPVSAREVELVQALGCVLAADVKVSGKHPSAAIALRDGFAVRAEDTADGNSYAPVPLPIAVAVDAGDPLPEGADAVAASESIVSDGGAMQAIAPVAGGEGALAAGADAAPHAALLRAGVRLNALALAAMQALGISRVAVRKPRVRILIARASEDAILAAATALLRALVTKAGGEIVPVPLDGDAAPLSDADSDFIVIVGGSGTGARDLSVQMLAHAGQVAFHGIGLAPGETAALGNIGKASVLVVPGRLDAAFAVWVTLGAAILSRLAGSADEIVSLPVKLARKVTSTIGMVELVPVMLENGEVTPLASGYLPLGTMAQADGYIVVPAESEGFPPGAQVAMRKMP